MLLFLLIVLLSAAGSAVHRPAAQPATHPDAAPAALPVSVITARPVSSFAQTRHYTGTLVAGRTSELSFQRSAEVVEIAVDEGDAVQTGDEIARLDVRRLDTAQQILEAQRAAAAARLRELQAGPRRETIEATRAQVAELEAQQELAERTHRRTLELQARNSASAQAVDNTLLSLEAATARLRRARRRLEELESGTRQEQIDAQRAAVAQLDARLADLKLDREDSVLRAPFAGRISRRYLDEGTVVTVGQPVVRLVEDTVLEARIGLPADRLSHLHEGDSVTLRHKDRLLKAAFLHVLPEVDLRTRTQTAVFRLTEQDARKAAPGQTVRITLTSEVPARGFWLPTTALAPSRRGLWSAYVVDHRDGHDVIAERTVEVLHTEGDRVLVTGTLYPEDRVVATGVHRVVPGQRVTVLQP